MPNRREFLQVGLAATTLATGVAGSVKASVSGAASQNPFVSFYKVIYDKRYTDSVRFAEKLQQNSQKIHGINGDITSFWFAELDKIWRKNPVAIAGLTAHGPLFCLERLAWEKGMRVVYRGDHKLQSAGVFEHQQNGPDELLAKARSGVLSLASRDANWSEALAELMLECPQGQIAMTSQKLTAPISDAPVCSGAMDYEKDPLISWIIAPARQV